MYTVYIFPKWQHSTELSHCARLLRYAITVLRSTGIPGSGRLNIIPGKSTFASE